MNKKTLGAIVAIAGIGAALGSRAYYSYKILSAKKKNSESHVSEDSDFDLNDVLNEKDENIENINDTDVDKDEEPIVQDEKVSFNFEDTFNKLNEESKTDISSKDQQSEIDESSDDEKKK